MALIADVFTRVDQLVNTFVTGGYTTLASEVSPAVWSAFTLYVMVIGIAYLRQSYHITLADLAVRLMRGAIVLTLALNWGVFSSWVYNGLFSVLNSLGTTMVAGITGGAATSGNAIETGFMRIFTGASTLLQASLVPPEFPSISRIVSALCLVVGGLLLYGAAIFVMLFAKVAFAVTVVLAPAFIPFAMFDATKDVFGAWVRTVAGFAVIPALATCVLSFQLGLMNANLDVAATGLINITDAGITLLMCVAFFLIMKQVPGIGGGLVGAPVTAGGSAMAELFMRPLTKAGSAAIQLAGGKAGQAGNAVTSRLAALSAGMGRGLKAGANYGGQAAMNAGGRMMEKARSALANRRVAK